MVSSTSGAGKTGQLHAKMQVDRSLAPYTEVNSKRIKDLNVRLDARKLGENTSRTLYDIN